MKIRSIYLLIGFIILVLLAMLVFLFQKKAGPFTKLSIPVSSITPAPFNSQPSNALFVTLTSPQNNENNVPTTVPVNFVFNKTVDPGGITIDITPKTAFTYQVLSENLIISFSGGLQPNTPYTVNMRAVGMSSSYQLVFTTAAQNPKDTSPGLDAMRQQADHLRQTNPDVYLSNNVPYSGKDFSIALGSLKPVPTSHYSFVVTLINSNQVAAKNSFINWLHSLNLADSQIQGMDFAYITPQQAQAVATLKNQFPYFGHNFVIDYDQTQDKTSITIFKDQTQGDQNLNTFLNSNGVNDRYWINNLTVTYQ